MSKSKVTIVGPATVRALFHDGTLDASKVTVTRTVKGETVEQPANPACLTSGPQGRGRGRVAQPFVQAALAHLGKGHVFKEKVESVPTVTVPVTVKSKRGATLQRPQAIPLADFRAVSGQAKGRPSKANLALVAQVIEYARDSK